MIKGSGLPMNWNNTQELLSRRVVVAILLGIALIAFEIFNFDTTKFALSNLMGEVRFAGVLWASILAIAFCAIDFAGLVRIFTPEKGAEEPRAVWFLTGAWFLGTIANSVLTWWAVSLTLLSHDFGNEVLSREALLRYVPIFVAMLVWLTRILFIGAFSVAGEKALDDARAISARGLPAGAPRRDAQYAQPVRAGQQTARAATNSASQRAGGRQRENARLERPAPQPAVTYEPIDDPIVEPAAPKTNGSNGPARPSRIQQRPPMPGNMRRTPAGMQARPSKPNR